MLPNELKDDPDEALLYLYYSVRYFDEHMFKVILQCTNNMSLASTDIQMIFRDKRSYQRLTNEDSMDRDKLNQLAFEVAVDKDYTDVAYHFIEMKLVRITWDMIRRMLQNRQEYLVKQCIKFDCEFDSGSAQVKKIIFAGRTAKPKAERTIRLVDFI